MTPGVSDTRIRNPAVPLNERWNGTQLSRLVAFRRTLDLRGYGQENPGHVVGVVEDGLEEGYPQELPRILAVRRKRGLAVTNSSFRTWIAAERSGKRKGMDCISRAFFSTP